MYTFNNEHEQFSSSVHYNFPEVNNQFSNYTSNYYHGEYLNMHNDSNNILPNNTFSQNSPIYEDVTSDDSSSDSGIAMCNTNTFPTSITSWNSDQVMKWILELYDIQGFRYEDLNLHYFKKKDGQYLISLNEQDWEKIDKKRSKFLYESVQRLVRESLFQIRRTEIQARLSVISYSSSRSSLQSSGYNSGTQSSDEEEQQVIPYVRRRGRPRSATAKRRNSQKLGRVWEFLRDLLLNPQYCPRIICWEDYPSRVFRLVDGNEVARMWGDKKKNPKMNYGKFSRSIRHYYKLKVIESVTGKRYVYKFGENAEGCETDNPNFGINVN